MALRGIPFLQSLVAQLHAQAALPAGLAAVATLAARGGITATMQRSQRAYSDQVVPRPVEEKKEEPRRASDSEWTEVVDLQTGQTYFWNESTGETTELGEPRPKTRFRDQTFRGANDARFQEGWKEPPDQDKTYTYSLIGTSIGFVAAYCTRYLH